MEAPPVPSDCVPTAAHLVLLALEMRHLAKTLPLSVEVTGIPAVDHIVIVVDLRGQLGRIVGEAVMGEAAVEHCLDRAARTRLPPSLGVPWPLQETIPLLLMCGRDLLEAVVARPGGTLAVLLVDRHDNPALMFVPPERFLGRGSS